MHYINRTEYDLSSLGARCDRDEQNVAMSDLMVSEHALCHHSPVHRFMSAPHVSPLVEEEAGLVARRRREQGGDESEMRIDEIRGKGGDDCGIILSNYLDKIY
jgi:hypothetical protein